MATVNINPMIFSYIHPFNSALTMAKKNTDISPTKIINKMC